MANKHERVELSTDSGRSFYIQRYDPKTEGGLAKLQAARGTQRSETMTVGTSYPVEQKGNFFDKLLGRINVDKLPENVQENTIRMAIARDLVKPNHSEMARSQQGKIRAAGEQLDRVLSRTNLNRPSQVPAILDKLSQGLLKSETTTTIRETTGERGWFSGNRRDVKTKVVDARNVAPGAIAKYVQDLPHIRLRVGPDTSSRAAAVTLRGKDNGNKGQQDTDGKSESHSRSWTGRDGGTYAEAGAVDYNDGGALAAASADSLGGFDFGVDLGGESFIIRG